MTNRIKVVSAFVPLQVKHLSPDQYHDLGTRLRDCCAGDHAFFQDALPDCWLSKEHPPMVPATDTPADRYEDQVAHVKSHIVQHNRTTWALRALRAAPDTDVLIWLDYGILKQGVWNGKQLTEQHVRDFLEKVRRYDFTDIPFPGITQAAFDPFGNNWRFCGSTHIWPARWLERIDQTYKVMLREFIDRHHKVPLDLTIWPLVEQYSGLPFRWYKAEYDHTQLTEFPG